jgi:arsenate reductase
VLEYLKSQSLPTEGARSKDWHELAGAGAPPLDFVFFVGDEAACATPPAFPGEPMTAHWSVEDPAPYWDQPEKARQLVREAFHTLQRRISLFTNLPLEKLDKLSLQHGLHAIGETV